jgi:hypothetical protein
VDLDPDGARWFLLCGFDDPAGVLAAMGLATPGAAHSRWRLLSHAASMVAVVTSIIAGVGVALAANAVGGGQLPVAASATVGAVVIVAGTAGFGVASGAPLAGRRGQRPQPVPSHPGQAASADLQRPGTGTSQAHS